MTCVFICRGLTSVATASTGACESRRDCCLFTSVLLGCADESGAEMAGADADEA